MSEFSKCSLSWAYVFNLVDLGLSDSSDHKHQDQFGCKHLGTGLGGFRLRHVLALNLWWSLKKSQDMHPVQRICPFKRKVSFRVASFCSVLTSGHLLKDKIYCSSRFFPLWKACKASNCFTVCWLPRLCPTPLFIWFNKYYRAAFRRSGVSTMRLDSAGSLLHRCLHDPACMC